MQMPGRVTGSQRGHRTGLQEQQWGAPVVQTGHSGGDPAAPLGFPLREGGAPGGYHAEEGARSAGFWPGPLWPPHGERAGACVARWPWLLCP